MNGEIKLLLESIGYLMKIPFLGMGYLPTNPSAASKIIQVIATAVGCPLELDGKALLMKQAHALV